MNSTTLPLGGSKAERRPKTTAIAVDSQGIPATGDLIDENDGQARLAETSRQASGAANQIICPDPSAHDSSQASKHPQPSPMKEPSKMNSARAVGAPPLSLLDKEGKLSSAGTRLPIDDKA